MTGNRKLVKKIIEAKNSTDFRMGTITATDPGPPRTVTVDMGGVSVPSVSILDSVDPVIGVGIWIVDMGQGRLLGIGTIAGSPTVTIQDVYQPTLTGMAVGTGGSALNTARYVYNGGANVGDWGMISIWGTVTFGTTGRTFPTNPFMALPPGFNFSYDVTRGVGLVDFRDSSTPANNRYGVLNPASSSVVRPSIVGFSNAPSTITTTTPFTWDNGDSIFWQLLGVPVVRV